MKKIVYDAQEGAENDGAAKTRRLSLVWVVPVAALLISAWLLYDTYQNKGPTVVISFKSAEGLQAGKSKVKYLDTEIGEVSDIAIDGKAQAVLVTVEFVPSAKHAITEGVAFWVVRPQIKAGRLSGLGTLLSGSYIAAVPGPEKAKPVTHVEGFEIAPVRAEHPGAIQTVLLAKVLKSVGVGTPVLYSGLQIGELGRSRLADDLESFEIDAYIYAEYKKLLVDNVLFWNVGGFSIDVGKAGIHAGIDSLAGLIAGGVQMARFDEQAGSPVSDKSHQFALHDDYTAAKLAHLMENALKIVLESVDAKSLKAGEPIYYRKMEIGEIDSVGFNEDASKIIVNAHIEDEYRKFVTDTTHFWNASGVDVHLGLKGLNISTESMETFLVGGIALAPGEAKGSKVSDGQRFILYREAKKHWRKSDQAVP